MTNTKFSSVHSLRISMSNRNANPDGFCEAQTKSEPDRPYRLPQSYFYWCKTSHDRITIDTTENRKKRGEKRQKRIDKEHANAWHGKNDERKKETKNRREGPNAEVKQIITPPPPSSTSLLLSLSCIYIYLYTNTFKNCVGRMHLCTLHTFYLNRGKEDERQKEMKLETNEFNMKMLQNKWIPFVLFVLLRIEKKEEKKNLIPTATTWTTCIPLPPLKHAYKRPWDSARRIHICSSLSHTHPSFIYWLWHCSFIMFFVLFLILDLSFRRSRGPCFVGVLRWLCEDTLKIVRNTVVEKSVNNSRCFRE